MSAPAKTLSLGFEGYFACRIATDPDPTDEPRGMSGYTMALAHEDPLDQVIRLQIDDAYLERNAREPMREMFRDRRFMLGVKVRSVSVDGQPWAAGAGLINAPLTLNGGEAPLKGPAFDSRNAVAGNDDAMAFVIYPFNLHVGSDGGKVGLSTQEDLQPLWKFPGPEAYNDRLSWVEVGAAEVSEAVGVYDTYGYFRDRRRTLAKLIAEAEQALARGEGDPAALEARIQGWKSRTQQLEFWGDRVISKMATRCLWRWTIKGKKTFFGDIGGTVDTTQPWPIEFWMGGWDGDLLIGYMKGTLKLPFTPAAA
ncbi:MAG TPA: hypothetical protein VFQ16_04195 [Burkholderiaceae bacterium]|nr:hypothetical protein [Burkholderiaceae bacterium]